MVVVGLDVEVVIGFGTARVVATGLGVERVVVTGLCVVVVLGGKYSLCGVVLAGARVVVSVFGVSRVVLTS